jgi:hypothetical protein
MPDYGDNWDGQTVTTDWGNGKNGKSNGDDKKPDPPSPTIERSHRGRTARFRDPSVNIPENLK